MRRHPEPCRVFSGKEKDPSYSFPRHMEKYRIRRMFKRARAIHLPSIATQSASTNRNEIFLPRAISPAPPAPAPQIPPPTCPHTYSPAHVLWSPRSRRAASSKAAPRPAASGKPNYIAKETEPFLLLFIRRCSIIEQSKYIACNSRVSLFSWNVQRSRFAYGSLQWRVAASMIGKNGEGWPIQ